MGRRQIWVDDELEKYIDNFGKDLELKLGFKPSKAKITKTLAKVLTEREFIVKDGKKKRNTKKTFEFTILL